MEMLATWDALQRCVGNISRAQPGYTTNLYATREQVEHWCAVTPMPALVADGAVIVLRPDRDFHHVFHIARDMPSLTAALTRLPHGSYSTDLIGRDDDLAQVRAAYAAAGFADHAYLRRMNRIQTVGGHDKTDAMLAGTEDAAAVAAFLDRLLDRFAEQVPAEAEIAAAAAAGRLLVARHDGKVAGMLMYDLKGQLAHLRFWHVDTDMQGKGIGRQLMAGFLAGCARARRVMLWVMGDNERSIAIYRRYGFAEDGLLDRIMTLHKDPH